MNVLAFVNQKGKKKKTTSALNIGAALAIEGKKVLLIDLDPQGSLSKCAGFRSLEDSPTSYEVIKGDVDINDAVKHKKSVADYDILPTDIRMSGAEIELISAPGRDTLLKDALKDLRTRYDFVLIDCSPSLNILTLMALTAANSVIIPVAAQYMPLDGMAQLLPTIELVKKRLNRGLEISGVLVTMYDGRLNLSKEVEEAVRARFPDHTFKTIVKNNSKLAEAPTYSKDIFDYAPKSAGATAYRSVAKEILEREVYGIGL